MGCKNTRVCPSLPNQKWLETGVLRVLSDEPSGRSFLQKRFDAGLSLITRSHFFESLKAFEDENYVRKSVLPCLIIGRGTISVLIHLNLSDFWRILIFMQGTDTTIALQLMTSENKGRNILFNTFTQSIYVPKA